MYDSPETRLVKDVFNSPHNFDRFYAGLRQITPSSWMSRKYAEEMYKILRNEIRTHFKKRMKAPGVDVTNPEVRQVFVSVMESSIDGYLDELGKTLTTVN